MDEPKKNKRDALNMEYTLYKRLATHIDNLPGGFPSTESGVELKILQRLFTEEEAELALRLTLISEDVATIAFRAGIPADEASERLETMAGKGLIFRSKDEGKPPKYMAAQFVVGIWELQVGRLTPELVGYMDEYMPDLLDIDAWSKAPQMRVIPVGKSIDPALEIMTYERAESLVKNKEHFVVAECICRKERQIDGEGCKKPLETCISFGGDEDFYLKNGVGRKATREEVLDLLKKADRAGLVLQPSNGKDVDWICCCCGCCCGILRTIKKYPDPASVVASPFTVFTDASTCTGCGVCVVRCQMDALEIEDGRVILNSHRCIGCGLCVSTCSPGSLVLVRKPASDVPGVPRDIVAAALKLSWKRGKIGPISMLKMVGQSFVDRYRSGNLLE